MGGEWSRRGMRREGGCGGGGGAQKFGEAFCVGGGFIGGLRMQQ